MTTTIGWDIGGAHLKAARVENGQVADALQIPCALWLGLDRLDAAFVTAQRRIGPAARHAVTMTGELTDAFASRAEGVAALANAARNNLTHGNVTIYAGRAGFVAPGEAGAHVADIASANWHASARWAAGQAGGGLFVDMGSTTTDLVPLADGQVAATGYTDAERMAAGELVYAGLARTFLMAVTPRVPFRGALRPLMNEYFASMADVYRILGELPAGADQHPAADGREKTPAASRARLARMLGLDAAEAPESAWTEVAQAFKEAQIRTLHDAAALVLSRHDLPGEAPLIGAGIGARVVRSLASRLGRPYLSFGQLLPARSRKARRAAADAAPAASVALLSESEARKR